MKMFYLVGVIAFASLLAFVGCSTGTDPEEVPAASIPSNLSDAGKVATDQSVELLEEVEEKIVANADSLSNGGSVVFSVNDQNVASTITEVADAQTASGGRSIPAAAETAKKVVTFAFDNGEEIEGTQTVTTYDDGSWDMEGTAKFKGIEGLDGVAKDVPIRYAKTKVDRDGKITGGNIEVDGTAIETKAFNALKKIAVFFKKLNSKVIPQSGGAPDPSTVFDITTKSSVSNVKQDGKAVAKPYNSVLDMLNDEDIQAYQAKLQTGHTMSANGFEKGEFTDGSLEWSDSSEIIMNAKENVGFTCTSKLVNESTTSIISSISAGETKMTVRSSSTLTINAEVDGMSIAFTDVKNESETLTVLLHTKTWTAAELAMSATESPSADEERFRWTGSITVDGTKIDISGAKMDVLSKMLSMGEPEGQAGNPGGDGGSNPGGDGGVPAGGEGGEALPK